MAKGFSTTGQPQSTPQTERVQYDGKTSDGYAEFAAKASVEQRFRLANELSAIEAEQLLQDASLLTAKRVQQSKASGDFTRRVAGHLVIGNSAETQHKNTLLAQVESHFVAEQIDPDFFTKSLLSSPTTLLLGEAR